MSRDPEPLVDDPQNAEEFWRGRCPDCAHPDHDMTCHETVPNGDPSNGPAYCPCASRIELMEQEIIRLRAVSLPVGDDTPSLDAADVETLLKALAIGFISWDGDGWYAKDAGYDYDDAEATLTAARTILARLTPQRTDPDE